jgi:hypothetical protein
MTLNFDHRGHLIPYGPIRTTVEEVERVFVKPYPGSKTRSQLFEVYQQYVSELRDLIGPFSQWIDGSFVTRSESPRDIDVLTFVDWKIMDQPPQALSIFRQNTSGAFVGIDPYFIRVLPQDHPRFSNFLADRAYWLDLFSKTRKSRRGRRLPKGFVELTFY